MTRGFILVAQTVSFDDSARQLDLGLISCSLGVSLTFMTPDDRERMIEVSRRIARETDLKKLSLWIADFNELLRRKIAELRTLAQCADHAGNIRKG
jgi:hypothetical protein